MVYLWGKMMSNILDKKDYYNTLFAYYEKLFTDKQQAMFIDYFYNDFSLAEIAESGSISRNAVYDTLKKVVNMLDEYEKKIGLYDKSERLEKILTEYDNNSECEELIKKIREME